VTRCHLFWLLPYKPNIHFESTTIVDETALDSGVFKQHMGGLKRANKLFGQPITTILVDFNRAL
jgi:type I restriction enzyme R subunit